MLELSGYTLEKIREGSESVLYRGRSADDDGSVLISTLLPSRTTPASLDRLRHEYSLADELDHAWAVRPIALVRLHGQPALVLQDPGGDPLDRRLGRPLDLIEFLNLATAMAAALDQIHRHGLIHKDVKPANIFVDDHVNARFTGFGIASRLPRERQGLAPPEVIAGTLAYMAPEQTGRMNRSIDSRADLYSLGVTLYELLVGALPFTAGDAMEWVHCHIARLPVAPRVRRCAIPEKVSEIIMKLLAKAAEERYQTACGLEADLRLCLSAWETHRCIDAFPLGGYDVPRRLSIPEKLHGREKQIEQLLTAFDRVVEVGRTELVLVSGYSGVGKSSVVNELHKVLVPPRGLFASGKFDQYKRDIPYATLAQAFQHLVRQILTQSDAEVARWRDTLANALEPNGQLIVQLIPELEVIIGRQPPVSELPPQEAKNRFQTVLRHFIGVFARAEHPLALFLDDLQWLDTATLELFEHLASAPDVRNLLLVGAYRDNEVDAAHPLMTTLARIRERGTPAHEISLSPLALDDLADLAAAALHCEPSGARPLAQLVLEKTGGNPFFAIQFMAELAEDNLIVFDRRAAAWVWDMDRIRARRFTDNVVDLMSAKLRRLRETTKVALGQLACLGNVAEIGTVTLAHEASEDELHVALWEALRAGIVFRDDRAYTFPHDRVHEAAYALIAESDRAAAHLRIGRLLVARTPEAELEENIFEIVNQLDRGAALIRSRSERERVAKLNLLAGKRAKASAAYASALRYFATGRALLGGDSWEQQYRLTVDLELGRAECEFLTGELAAAEESLLALAERAVNLVDRATVTCLRLSLYLTLDRSDRAVAVGLEYLRHLNVEWTFDPTDEEVAREGERLLEHIDRRPIDRLFDLPLMSDPDWLATMDVLAVLISPAQFTDTNLLDLVLLRMANLSLEHGHSNASCHGYSCLQFPLVRRFGDYEMAFQFGQLACDLVEKRGLDRLKVPVYVCVGAFVAPWMQDLLSSRNLLRRALDVADASGDVNYKAFGASSLFTNLLASGEALVDVQLAAEEALAHARKTGFGLIVDLASIQLRFVQVLRGVTPRFGSFDDVEFDEERFEEHLRNPRLALAAWTYWNYKLQARFFAKDYVASVAAGRQANALLWSMQSVFDNADHHFYAALARAAVCDGASPDERLEHLDALRVHHNQIADWAANCPETFAHRAALVAAEIARLEGRTLEAIDLYEYAVRAAREHGFVQNEGLANELAARFYSTRGIDSVSNAYLQGARACYLRWGALGKVRQLEHGFPLLREWASTNSPAIDTTIARLDLDTIVKTSQAVSGEIVLDRLIERLMKIAVEHAGAVRGLLLLPRGDAVNIAAEAISTQQGVAVRMPQGDDIAAEFPESILRFVMRSHESVILGDAVTQNPYAADDYIRRKLPRSILCLPLIKQGRLIGALYIENGLSPHVFTPARMTGLQVLASQAAISLENARLYQDLLQAEQTARRSENALRRAFDTIPTLAWSALPDGNSEFLNKQWHEFAGISRADGAPEEWKASFHPDDLGKVEDGWRRAIESGHALEIEARMRRFDGENRRFLIRATPLRDDSGTIVKWYGTNTDIEELKRTESLLRGSLEEKEALLKEVHHRVKNNLQLISSLLSLQAARIAEAPVAELFAESGNRIRSMAQVHENLYRAGNFSRIGMGAHVHNLCAHLVRVYGLHNRQVALSPEIDEIELDLDQAIPAGLIINELVSNALKHAFPNGKAGHVRVELKQLGEGRCALSVQDDGIGLSSELDLQRAESLGLQLVHNLTLQLHGTIIVSRDCGTSFVLEFPAGGAEAAQ